MHLGGDGLGLCIQNCRRSDLSWLSSNARERRSASVSTSGPSSTTTCRSWLPRASARALIYPTKYPTKTKLLLFPHCTLPASTRVGFDSTTLLISASICSTSALKAAASATKEEWLRNQTDTRTKCQTAVSVQATTEGAAASAEAARTSNERALADVQSDLAILEADGKTMTEPQHELNGRRRECESADAGLADIDAVLKPLPRSLQQPGHRRGASAPTRGR